MRVRGTETEKRELAATDHRFWDRHILIFLFLPAFLVLFALTIGPLLSAFWLSFTDYNLTNPDSGRFVGLPTYGFV